MARKKRSSADRAMLGSARRLGSGTTTRPWQRELDALKARIRSKTFIQPLSKPPPRSPSPRRRRK